MKTKHFLTILLLIACMGFTSAQITKVASVEGITEYKMNNELKVLLFADNSEQTITVNIT